MCQFQWRQTIFWIWCVCPCDSVVYVHSARLPIGLLDYWTNAAGSHSFGYMDSSLWITTPKILWSGYETLCVWVKDGVGLRVTYGWSPVDTLWCMCVCERIQWNQSESRHVDYHFSGWRYASIKGIMNAAFLWITWDYPSNTAGLQWTTFGWICPNRYHLKSSRSVSCMEKLVINKCILHSVSMTELHCSLLYHKAVDHKTPVLCS